MLALTYLPGALQTSIVGTSELNFRVRNGNGWTLTVINTNLSLTLLTLNPYIFYIAFALFSLVTRTGIEPMLPA